MKLYFPGIVTKRGQWDFPGKITTIPSNNITMRSVPFPVLGVSNTGHSKIMPPNSKNHKFRGQFVTEYPLLQQGGIYMPNKQDPGHREEYFPDGTGVSTPINTYVTNDMTDPKYKSLTDFHSKGLYRYVDDINDRVVKDLNFEDLTFKQNPQLKDQLRPIIANIPANEQNADILTSRGIRDILKKNKFTYPQTNVDYDKLYNPNEANQHYNKVSEVFNSKVFNDPAYHKPYRSPYTDAFTANDHLRYKDEKNTEPTVFAGMTSRLTDIPYPLYKPSSPTHPVSNISRMEIPQRRNIFQRLFGRRREYPRGNASFQFQQEPQRTSLSDLSSPQYNIPKFQPTQVVSPINNIKPLRSTENLNSLQNVQYPYTQNSFTPTANTLTPPTPQRPTENLSSLSIPQQKYNPSMTGTQIPVQGPSLPQKKYTTHPIDIYDRRGKYLRQEFIGDENNVVDHKYIGNKKYAPRGGNSYLDLSTPIMQQGGSFRDRLLQQNVIADNLKTQFPNPNVQRDLNRLQQERYSTQVRPSTPTTPYKQRQSARLNQAYVNQHPYAQINEQGQLEPKYVDRTMQGAARPFTNAAKVDQGLNTFAHGLDAAAMLTGAYDVGRLGLQQLKPFLKNTYKLNPWAFKPNPEAYYRVLGKEGLNDALESGAIRANPNNIHPFSGKPVYDRPYFSKGIPFDRDWKTPFKNKKGKQVIGSIYPDETMVEVFGHDRFHKTGDLVTSPINTLNSFDKDINFYKRDWLRGYKEVPKPKIFSQGKPYELAPHIYQDMYPINKVYHPRTVITDGAVKNEILGLEPTPIIPLNTVPGPAPIKEAFYNKSVDPKYLAFEMNVERTPSLRRYRRNKRLGNWPYNIERVNLKGDELKYYQSLDKDAQELFIKNYKLR